MNKSINTNQKPVGPENEMVKVGVMGTERPDTTEWLIPSGLNVYRMESMSVFSFFAFMFCFFCIGVAIGSLYAK